MKLYNIVYLVLLLSLVACNIDKKPYDSLTPDDLNASPASLESATLGNYARLKTMTLGWHRVQEFPGDNVSLSGVTSSHLIYLYNYQRIPTNSFANSFWQNSYKVIVAGNKIIESVEEGQSEEIDQLIGENYYLRAMLHFTLCNIFGKPYTHGTDNLGVPIKVDADPQNHPTRATVAEVYRQVIADLEKAEQLMTIYKSNVYASKEAVWALLSRVYLYMDNLEKTIEYADKVIESPRFSLLPTSQLGDYPTIKPESNPETILALKFIPNQDLLSNGWSNIGSIYSTIDGVGYGEMYASRSYLELVRRYPQDQRNLFIQPAYLNNNRLYAVYVNNASEYVKVAVQASGDTYRYTDSQGNTHLLEREMTSSGYPAYFIRLSANDRRKVFVESEIDERNGYPKYFIVKCSRQEGQAQLWSPIISRLAEIYLNRAEAYAKLNRNQEALDDLNLIRSRAGIPATGLYDMNNLPEGQTLLEVILDERRLELAWEGHRKLDVFRNKLDMDRNYPGIHLVGNDVISDISWQDNHIVEYIPESQILVHEGLQQNP